MSKYERYFLMQSGDVLNYIKEKLDFFDIGANLECAEIGDGNLNYVFRIWDKESNKSLIVKQAGVTARISDDFKLSTNRAKIEADVLQLENELAPGLVPFVYQYDDVMSCTVMEDLSDYKIMRQALNEYEKFPLFADHISTFMVNTLLLTTDVVLDHQQKKQLVQKYSNPELCEITEDLVYTEPFNDYRQRNDVFGPNLEWVRKEFYGDKELRLEAAKLKFQFMTHAQALIHGDLHTGSFFVKQDSTKVIDPEFAFYGPIGYDVGNVMANLIFAWIHAEATMKDVQLRLDYLAWLETTISNVIDLFKNKFLQVWEQHATDLLAKEKGLAQWYLATVMEDTSGVTGLELSRRVIGLAHVKDIISITDEYSRLRAERICLTAAKRFIKERQWVREGKDYLRILQESVSVSSKEY